MNDIELKPCPFCGAAARIAEDSGDGSKYRGPHFVVRCPSVVGEYVSGCAGNFINLWDMTPEDAAKRWNTRAALTPPEGFVLVPVEPTEDMAAATVYNGIDYVGSFDMDDFRKDYAAMLAARPEIPDA